MNELKKALAEADEESITALANKGIYKRACKDIDGLSPESEITGETAEISIGGETVTLKAPLSECRCSCVSRTVCRHIIGAILLMKNSLTEEDVCDAVTETKAEEINAEPSQPAPVSEPEINQESDEKPLTDKQKAKINQCAEQTLSAMSDILRRGLVRVPDTLAENLEISAVRCHSLRMADAERSVREISGKLSDCISRRSSFSIRLFTKQFCECVKMLNELSDNGITTENLGVFRQKYESCKGSLTLLPIGQRHISGGEYEGEVYYFLNTDEEAEQRFLTVSDLRPVFYEKSAWSRRQQNIMPWGLTVPLKKMMTTKMVLGNAKINDGKLSTSQETQVLMQTKANLDCDEIKNLIYDDFSRIIIELSERTDESETDRLFFVHPKKCVSSEFDRYTQNYVMTIEDYVGRQISVRAKYRDDKKEFISLLEKIGQKMLNEPNKKYVILASAYIEDGRLNLFPIEIYDFIRPYPHEEYELPDEFAEACANSYHAGTILDLLDEIQGKIELVMQCGLQSGIDNDHRLENKAFNYGLKGLSIMLADMMNSAEVYRHGNEASLMETMQTMADILDYIALARKKLELITALA